MSGDRGAPEHIRVGPAGWSSPDREGWVSPTPEPRGFNPLSYLAQSADTIEIKSTFDRIPLNPDDEELGLAGVRSS